MDISILKFAENLGNFDFAKKEITFEYLEVQEQKIIWGSISNIGNKPFPVYHPIEDKWYSFDEEDEDDWGDYELQYNIRKGGLIDLWIDDDPDQLCYYIFYNPIELNDFLNILPRANNKILSKRVFFKEFKVGDIIKEIYVSFSIDGSMKFIPITLLKKKLDTVTFNGVMKTIFLGDYEFLLKIGNWNLFFKEHLIDMAGDAISIDKIPILFSGEVYSNLSPSIDNLHPYLGISVKEKFSAQYFLDYLKDSKDGTFFLKKLGECILDNRTFSALTISAPGSFLEQIKYSTEFRLQLQEYKWEVESKENHDSESIVDLKIMYKNRRENLREFILNKRNAAFLDILKNPLPYNLEKSYRTYARAANELDRLTYAGKLYNLILKSIVFYPLEEILHLGLEEDLPEIQLIINQIKGPKPLSDGTWLGFFNTIASIRRKNNLPLSYFSPLIMAVESEYNKLQAIIPKRNNFAHYREHSAIFLKTLDEFLPNILTVLRDALKGNDFLLVESQNYKKEGLYITAKKIMGYEVDIETVEFKTVLEGKHFIQGSLIAYNERAKYTVPLENFFSVKIVQSEAVQMGIFKGGAGGGNNFEY